jgi:3-isopropylmalate/(R)-2-methylmalate dehydratase large subunit
MTARTLLDKLWDGSEILRRDDGASLLWVDRHLVHEGSHHAFAKIAERGLSVAEPGLTYGVVDHYAPTRGGPGTPAIARMIDTLEQNTRAHGITCFGLDDPRQGIVHVIGPEQGLTLPGLLINCGDSHTSTHGAFGALAFGIGATEVAHVLATQTIWQKKPAALRITVTGRLGPGVGAKDLALAWIAKLGADGARGHAIEYAGPAVEALSMEGAHDALQPFHRGRRALRHDRPGRGHVRLPEGPPLCAFRHRLGPRGGGMVGPAGDDGAEFAREVTLDAAEIAPIVTWGTSPEDALPVTATVPDPAKAPGDAAERLRAALDYMGLTPGQRLADIAVDQVFIGSCTNARIEDLRAAAAVLAGRRAKVPGLVSPGSRQVKAQAEAEGLDRIFTEAGLDWVGAGCSMCVAMNGDSVAPGKRCASTTNRNFRGRQGRGARTHLMSPAMVAAAAVTGHLTDVRPLLEGRPAA